MTEREVETIIERLQEAESMMLSVLRDDARRDCWNAANDCRVLIWKAIDKVGDLAR